jgi:TolB-like protein
MVSLHLVGAEVDAVEIERAVRSGLAAVAPEDLRRLADVFLGDFAEGLTLGRSPQLDHWLTTQRAHFRNCHAAILAELTGRLPPDDPEGRLLAEKWVALAPFDPRAHAALMSAAGPVDAERHLAAAVRLFEAEDMDAAPLHQAWRALRPGPAAEPASPQASDPLPPDRSPVQRPFRASLAIMPFDEPDEAGGARLGAGLTRDIISRLARLRSLFVIAQGSVFALAERGIRAGEAAQRLNVDFVASGVVRRRAARIVVDVELAEARTARIVWSETYEADQSGAFDILDRIGDTIVAAIVSEVEAAEKNRAVLKPPDSLNSWEAYHRGLWHMHRFTRDDNRHAQHFFRSSVEADPTFSRAYAGLSFTHWQNAFQGWESGPRETDLAFETAGRALMADDHDPSAHWAMGRALWLRREEHQATAELQQAVEISPNFAMGHYALAFVQSQSGDPAAAIRAADLSRQLSPFDPLLFGILGSKAMAFVRLGQFEEAAEVAVKAAARPNAHILIQQIAAFCLALAGRVDEARVVVAAIRSARPDSSVREFLQAFKFPSDAEALFRRAARDLGLD